MAFAAQVALLKRASEGGSWHVRVSLRQTARWFRDLGRIEYNDQATPFVYGDLVQTYDSGFGALKAIPYAAQFSTTRATNDRPSVPPGTHEPVWPS